MVGETRKMEVKRRERERDRERDLPWLREHRQLIVDQLPHIELL